MIEPIAADKQPPSSSDFSSLLDRLTEEYAERLRRGESPSIEEYATRYPRLADEIRGCFPALRALENAAVTIAADAAAARAPHPVRLGEFRIVRELGRGGMGVVYEAIQESLGRRVAVKILPLQATFDARYLERFKLEASAAARLEHPGIVPVIGVGEHDAVHYFAMQFIDGHGLDQVRDAVAARTAVGPDSPRDLSPTAPTESVARIADALLNSDIRGRPATPGAAPAPPFTCYARNVAQLGLDVATALAYAHGQGVLHRDIKPSNLLLDANGRVVITDFGLCKSTGSGDLTMSGDLIGTLSYMAPERLHGVSDVRGDVYGLGLTLYELLVRGRAFTEADRALLLKKVAQHSLVRPRRLDATIPRDLEAIVLKAIAPVADERYATADALARDLSAFLEHRPITARAPTIAYVLKLAMRRNKKLTTMTVVALVALAAMLALYTRDVRRGESRARRLSYVSSIAAADAALRDNDAVLARARLEAAPHEYRGWEWRHFDSARDQSLRSLDCAQQLPSALAYSPDDRWLAVGLERELWLYSESSATPIRKFVGGHRARIHGVSWHPGGELLATCGADGDVIVWDVAHGKRLATRRLGGVALNVHFSRSGEFFIAGGAGGEIQIWSTRFGLPLRTIVAGSAVRGLALAPDDRQVAAACADGKVRTWKLFARTEPRVYVGHELMVRCVAWSGDGRRLAAGGNDNSVRVWNVESGECIETLQHSDLIHALEFSADSTRLATIAGATPRLYDVATGEVLYQLRGHGRPVESLALNSDGSRMATGSYEGTLKEWHIAAPRDPDLLSEPANQVTSLAFHPKLPLLAIGGNLGIVRLWNLELGEVERTMLGHEGAVYAVAMAPDGEHLASGGYDQSVRLWQVASGREVREMSVGGRVRSLEFSRSGDAIFVGLNTGRLQVFDAARGALLAEWDAHAGSVESVRQSPDGARIVTGGEDEIVRIWDSNTFERRHELRGHRGRISGVAISPGGDRLASVATDQQLWLWDFKTGQRLAQLQQGYSELADHTEALKCVAFSPDGARLVTAANDGTLKLWDTAQLDNVAVLRGHSGWVYTAAFSPDGRRLAAGFGGGLRIWDTAPFAERARVLDAARKDRARIAQHVNALVAESGSVESALADFVSPIEWTKSEHEAALRLLHEARATPEQLERLCREWLRSASGDAHLFRVARGWLSRLQRYSERFGRESPELIILRGVAEFRCDSVKTSYATLHRAFTLKAVENGRDRALLLTFLAMAAARLGKHDEAIEHLAQLRALIASYSVDDAELAAGLAESEAAVRAAAE